MSKHLPTYEFYTKHLLPSFFIPSIPIFLHAVLWYLVIPAPCVIHRFLYPCTISITHYPHAPSTILFFIFFLCYHTISLPLASSHIYNLFYHCTWKQCPFYINFHLSLLMYISHSFFIPSPLLLLNVHSTTHC